MSSIQSRSPTPGVSPTSTASARTCELSGGHIVTLTNKKVIFVTEARDLPLESVVMPHLFSAAGVHKDSKVISYAEFFSTDQEVEKADILILRSSRLFAMRPTDLLDSLKRFRRSNPNSAVVVCVFDSRDLANLQPLKDSGVINVINQTSPDDQALMKGAVAYCR